MLYELNVPFTLALLCLKNPFFLKCNTVLKILFSTLKNQVLICLIRVMFLYSSECHKFLLNNDNVFHYRQKRKSVPIHDTHYFFLITNNSTHIKHQVFYTLFSVMQCR